MLQGVLPQVDRVPLRSRRRNSSQVGKNAVQLYSLRHAVVADCDSTETASTSQFQECNAQTL